MPTCGDCNRVERALAQAHGQPWPNNLYLWEREFASGAEEISLSYRGIHRTRFHKRKNVCCIHLFELHSKVLTQQFPEPLISSTAWIVAKCEPLSQKRPAEDIVRSPILQKHH